MSTEVVLAVGVLLAVNLAIKVFTHRAAGSTSTDKYFHLLYTSAIRANRHRIPRHSPAGVFRGPADYPWGLHWVLSFVPEHVLRRRPHWVGLTISVLLLLVVCTFVVAAPASVRGPVWWSVVIAGSSLIFSPGTMNQWSGLHGLSARPVGVLATTAWVLATWLQASFGDPMFWLASVAAAAVFLSSKFAVQCIVFGGAMMLVATGDARWIATVAAGLALAAVLSRGKVFTIMRGQIRHSVFYARQLQWSHVAMLRNRAVGAIFETLSKRRPKAVLRAAYHSTFVRGVAYQPFTFVALGLAASSGNPPTTRELVVVILVASALSVVTTLPPLRFLGEGDRYIQFLGLAPGALICGLLLPGRGPGGWALWFAGLALGLVVWGLELSARSERRGNVTDEDLERIGEALRPAGPSAGVLLCIPMNLSYAVEYATGRTTLLWAGNVTDEVVETEFAWLFPSDTRFPYPHADLIAIARRYGVTEVVFFKRYLAPEYLEPLGVVARYDTGVLEPLQDAERWVAYRIPRERER